jgi:hypothetical protein
LPEPYRLKVAGPAARSLEKVPERIAAAVVEFMTGRLPENPKRIGKPFVGPVRRSVPAAVAGSRSPRPRTADPRDVDDSGRAVDL